MTGVSRTLCVIFFICAATFPAAAQVTATLSGVVTDPGGAAVPGVEVVVTDQDTNRTFRTKTNERGEWTVASVPSATYRVSATAMGFKTTVVGDVKVEAGVPATVNLKLELGTVTETIEVAGGAEVLQTSTATVSSTLVGRQINELPLVSRNALDLLITQPGTQTPGTPRTSSVNGLPKGSMNITLDGINIQDNLLKSDDAYFATMLPKLDTVAEVTLSTAGLTADNSGEGAAQVRFVTRGGTNDYHGGLFWQHRNDYFNSNYYFNTIDKLPRDIIRLNQYGGRLGGPIKKDRLFFFVSHEEFRLPQTYRVGSYTVLTEQARRGLFTYRDTGGAIRTVDLFGLAAAANRGLPSGIREFSTAVDPRIARDLTEIAGLATPAAGNLRDRITDNNDYNRNNFNFQAPGKNRRRFSTVRLDTILSSKHQLEFVYNYQMYYANPDGVNSIYPIFPGTGSVLGSDPIGGTRRNAFSGVTALRSTLGTRITNEVRFGMRSGNSLFREEITPVLFERWGGYAPVYNYTSNPYTTRTQSRRNTPVWQLNESLTWSRGAHNLNFGGSFTHISNWNVATSTQNVPTVTFNIAANDPINTGNTSIFTTTNFPNSNADNRTQAGQLYALLTGRISATASSVAIDEKSKRYGPFPTVDRSYMREVGFYAQDSWRVRPGLNVTMGLRYDLQLPFKNPNETFTRVGIEGVYGISGVGNLFAPGVMTGSEPAFHQVESDQNAYRIFKKNFSPSLGFAYTIPGMGGPLGWLLGRNGGSVFRGGYSIATLREGMDTFLSLWASNQGRSVSTSVTPANFPIEFGAPGSRLFRDTSLPSRAAPDRPVYPIAVLPGNSVNDFDPNLRPAYVQSWNISLQRELTPDTVLDVRYVGNRGVKLWRQININEVNIIENGFLDEFRIAQSNLQIARRTNSASINFGNQGLPGQRDIPIISRALGLVSDTAFANVIAQGQAGSVANSIAFNATRMGRLTAAGYPANFFVANPTVSNGGAYMIVNGGNSNYNALQVEVRRRMSKGLLAQGSYVWSKSISDMQGSSSAVFDQPVTLRNFRLNRGPSPWDIRHALKMNWIYELPIGGNHRFLSSANPVVRKITEGWQIGGVARVQSGSPDYIRSGRFTLNSAADQDSTGDAGVVLHNMTTADLQKMVKIRKDPSGIVYYLPDALIRNSQAAFEVAGRSLNDLDPNAPYIGPPTTAGQLGGRVFIYGPRQSRWDASVIKKTNITENKNIELRVQFINVFNTTNFLLGAAGNEVNTALVNASFGQTRSAYRDFSVSGTNDPGGRLIEFALRFNF